MNRALKILQEMLLQQQKQQRLHLLIVQPVIFHIIFLLQPPLGPPDVNYIIIQQNQIRYILFQVQVGWASARIRRQQNLKQMVLFIQM